MTLPPPSKFPLELADRCVKCGVCLPHCPTYRLTGIEGESPRGRIALMQGMATGRLGASAALVDHLDRCLSCRACESACPANVPYGELIDAGRAMLAEQGVRPSPALRGLRGLLRRPALLRAALKAARLPGAVSLLRRMGSAPARMAALLPRAARPAARADPRPSAPVIRGEAVVFTGCVGAAIDGRTVDDIRLALASAGWAVRTPKAQRCCGAIDLHGGRPGPAGVLAQQNLAAFAGTGPIVACATGCAATLKEYSRIAGEDGARFSARVRDPVELLADAELRLGQGAYRSIVLHLPCTQRNVTGSGAATRRLLTRVPGLAIRELAAGCCGAAGEMFLSRPQLADALLEPLLLTMRDDPPDALVTSNVGCALHFAAGLARLGLDTPVLHPASVIVSALE
jgi:glycolate oxidase iron-sulfur subunit